jgi:hypothetical protein
MYERIMDIEEEVKKSLGEDEPMAYWGHEARNEIDLYMESDFVGKDILCSNCEMSEEAVEHDSVFDV